jgi:hypothetical protein
MYYFNTKFKELLFHQGATSNNRTTVDCQLTFGNQFKNISLCMTERKFIPSSLFKQNTSVSFPDMETTNHPYTLHRSST